MADPLLSKFSGKIRCIPGIKRVGAVMLPVCMLTCACVRIPKGIRAVEGTGLQRYRGKWYEVARLDHWFERKLSHVNATCQIAGSERMKIEIRGFNPEQESWTGTEITAHTAGDDTSQLRAYVLGPLSTIYNVIGFNPDPEDGYAVVCGRTRSRLWILSRKPQMQPDRLKDLVDRARQYGFPVEELTFVNQKHPPPLPGNESESAR